MTQLRISTRLLLGFVAVFVLIAAFVAAATLQLQSADNASSDMLKTESLARLATQIESNLRQNHARVVAIGFSDGSQVSGLFEKDLQATDAQIAQQVQALGQEARGTAVSPKVDTLVAGITAWEAVRKEMTRLRNEGDVGGSRDVLQSRLLPATTDLLATTGALVQQSADAMRTSRDAVNDAFHKIYIASGVFLAFALLTAAGICIHLHRRVSGGLARIADIVGHIGEGRLNSAIQDPGNDEIGQILQALEGMQAKLQDVMTQVMQGAYAVDMATGEIAQGNQSLSVRTENQASALQTTNAAMRSLAGSVQKNAESTVQANQLVKDASDMGRKASETVALMSATMGQINDSSQQIADITGLIDSIAFQTNILALNAAIEAARAGAQGRGFAVVATEVRSLASKSAGAAKHIKTLSQTSVERVTTGSALIERVGQTMGEIVTAIQQSQERMQDISGTTQTQANEITQTSTSIQNIEDFTQENTALVEQTAAAAASLKDQASDLLAAIQFFQLNTTDPIADTRPGTAAHAPAPRRSNPGRANNAFGLPARARPLTLPPTSGQ